MAEKGVDLAGDRVRFGEDAEILQDRPPDLEKFSPRLGLQLDANYRPDPTGLLDSHQGRSGDQRVRVEDPFDRIVNIVPPGVMTR